MGDWCRAIDQAVGESVSADVLPIEGSAGHLNSTSRLGAWGFGRSLLTAFSAGTGRP
ncbi:hypothetical protein [Nonomuraea roseola]|uniref:Uncharacterized protein n=1 Tax=Nonomuraea roseola TaxID=46179 RepID=A0ABV5QGD5_9ACTN